MRGFDADTPPFVRALSMPFDAASASAVRGRPNFLTRNRENPSALPTGS